MKARGGRAVQASDSRVSFGAQTSASGDIRFFRQLSIFIRPQPKFCRMPIVVTSRVRPSVRHFLEL